MAALGGRHLIILYFPREDAGAGKVMIRMAAGGSLLRMEGRFRPLRSLSPLKIQILRKGIRFPIGRVHDPDPHPLLLSWCLGEQDGGA